MEMQNRSDFEKEWEKAFNDAGMDISPGLWEKVELNLMNASNKRYKKRILLFQLLAAASVAFALSVAGVGIYHLYYNEDKPDENVLTDITTDADPIEHQSLTPGEQLADAKGFTKRHADGPIKKESGQQDRKTSPSAVNRNAETGYNGTKLNSRVIPEKHTADETFATKENSHVNKNRPIVQPVKVDPLVEYLETARLAEIEMHRVPQYSYMSAPMEERNRMWAGIGFSAGTFNPNATSTATANSGPQTLAFDANSKRTPSFSREKAGQAINIGFNFGTRLSERWVLQSGIVYIQQQTTSTSNVVSTDRGESAKALSNFNEISSTETIAFTAPYDVNNTYELIAVPLQAGYVILDKQLSIILLSGISNNILLQNQIGSTGGNFEEVEISSGSDSRYRTYQVSGVFGSEFNYSFGGNYMLSIVPQIRQAINSITKPEVDYSSRPTTLEIGFRLKYIFGK